MSPIRARWAASFALILAACGASWYLMLIFHELGHVLHARVSGGQVIRVVLEPWSFSRTDLGVNPHPLFVAWGGVLWGTVLPLALWLAGRNWTGAYTFLLRFLAGFCLLANGAYLATALGAPVGDVQDLLRLGAPRGLLAVVGVLGLLAGLALWSPLGPAFGTREGEVRGRTLLLVLGVMLALLAMLLAWTGGHAPDPARTSVGEVVPPHSLRQDAAPDPGNLDCCFNSRPAPATRPPLRARHAGFYPAPGKSPKYLADLNLTAIVELTAE